MASGWHQGSPVEAGPLPRRDAAAGWGGRSVLGSLRSQRIFPLCFSARPCAEDAGAAPRGVLGGLCWEEPARCRGGHWGSHRGHPEGVAGGQGGDGTGAGKQERYCSGDLRRAEQNTVSLGAPSAPGGTGLQQGAAVPGARCPEGVTGTTNNPADTGVQQHHHSPRVLPAHPQHEEGPCGPTKLCLRGFTARGHPCVPLSVPRAPRCPQRSANRVPPLLSP